jgi:isopenicillin-N N-acyltransferase-like protein
MRDFSWRDKNSVSLQDGGCSVFSVRGKTERICGQTWDMDATALSYVVHLSLKASDKSELSSEVFSLTGCLGLSGVNSKSVGVFINNLHCRETGNGLAWPALVRGMLNQDSAASALKFMETHLPASGHNYLICDPKETLNVESTGQRVVVTARSSSPGAIFHTNHYVDPSLKDQEISERRSLTTHGRYGALETFFRGFKFDGFTYDSVAQGVFEGETGKTVSIPLPPAARHDIKKAPAAVTCGGILVDLVARTGELYAGVYADGDRRAIRW